MADTVCRNQRWTGSWKVSASVYAKLRLSKAWVQETLRQTGFFLQTDRCENGFVTLIARKPT